jgi:hypothetical protein
LTFDGKRLDKGLCGFSDADWAGDPSTRRSVSGYCFIFSGAAVAWSSKKQPMIALSSTKAEYMATMHAGKEATYLDHLLNNSDISSQKPITIFADNQSALAIAENPIFHA